jgi:hypothetical protein
MSLKGLECQVSGSVGGDACPRARAPLQVAAAATARFSEEAIECFSLRCDWAPRNCSWGPRTSTTVNLYGKYISVPEYKILGGPNRELRCFRRALTAVEEGSAQWARIQYALGGVYALRHRGPAVRPPRGCLAFPAVNRFRMACSHGRAGRFTAKTRRRSARAGGQPGRGD